MAEEVAGSSRTDLPAWPVWVGVTPHKVAEGALMGNFLATLKESDLIEGLNIRRKTAMDAENFAFNDGTNAQMVHNIDAILPGVGITVFTHVLIVKAIHGSDLARLVVTTEESDVAWVAQLEHHKQLDQILPYSLSYLYSY